MGAGGRRHERADGDPNGTLTRSKQPRRTFSAVRILLGAGAAVAVAAATAFAGFTPAWSYVPAPLRAQLATRSGGSLYLPARAPLSYRYRSGAVVANGVLTVPFTNRVRVRQGVWRWTSATFVWHVRRLPAGTACTAWATRDKTLQVDGNKVYWSQGTDGGTAWRCVVDRRGRSLVLSASAAARLGDVGLAVTVASGLDVAARTNAPRASIVVTPSTVRRGGTVLVRGLAQGCTSGDQVTLISRAFPPAHEFAGVPAVFAQVGAAGRFSATTRIPSTRRPGTYSVTGRCGGGNLGVSAHVTVTR